MYLKVWHVLTVLKVLISTSVQLSTIRRCELFHNMTKHITAVVLAHDRKNCSTEACDP